MPKKKKIKLEGLKVKSFVTVSDGQTKKALAGATETVTCETHCGECTDSCVTCETCHTCNHQYTCPVDCTWWTSPCKCGPY